MELALTWLFQNTDAETVLSRKLSQEGASSVLLQKDTTESNKLHKSWRRSKFCKDVEKLLSGAELGDEGARYPESDDQDSDTEDPPPQSIFNLPESSDSSGAPVHTATPVQMPITRVPQEKVSISMNIASAKIRHNPPIHAGDSNSVAPAVENTLCQLYI